MIYTLQHYRVDFTLVTAITKAKSKIERIEYCLAPEFTELYGTTLISKLKTLLTEVEVKDLDIDRLALMKD